MICLSDTPAQQWYKGYRNNQPLFDQLYGPLHDMKLIPDPGWVVKNLRLNRGKPNPIDMLKEHSNTMTPNGILINTSNCVSFRQQKGFFLQRWELIQRPTTQQSAEWETLNGVSPTNPSSQGSGNPEGKEERLKEPVGLEDIKETVSIDTAGVVYILTQRPWQQA